MSDLIDRLRYRVNNPSAWPEGFDEQGSELFREAAKSIEEQALVISELVEAIDKGAQVNTPEMMEWVADRLVFVYGESPNVDFVQSLRIRAERLRSALSKARSTTPREE